MEKENSSQNKTHSLYNIYRPNNFDEVYGQEVILEVLKNSIKKNKLHHSYLLTGIHGIGKTTIARIFAKAINCENLQPNQNPCNECTSCIAINNDNSFDVIEIDAASNNGVEEIRNLKDKTNYLLNSKYKIFLIDEVHMLSKSAFNAFLKLLEEPPKNVIFILLTTEINKIPDTILSRTVILELKIPSNEIIIKTLSKILIAEKINFEDEALKFIAEFVNSSIRDSISLLEKLIIETNNEILLNNVLKSLDFPSDDFLYQLVKNEDKLKLLELIKNSSNAIKIINYFNSKVISFLINNQIKSSNFFVNFINDIINILLLTNDPKIIYSKSILYLSDIKVNNNNFL